MLERYRDFRDLGARFHIGLHQIDGPWQLVPFFWDRGLPESIANCERAGLLPHINQHRTKLR